MISRVISTCLALGALALAAHPRAGVAQPRAVPRVLAGAWVHDGDVSRAVRTVDAAFAPTISTLPEILHGMARDRIHGSMPPPRRVEVVLDAPRVRVTLRSPRTTVVDGPLGAHARTSGVESGTHVTPRLEGGWLELLYEGEGSQLRQLFSTEPDGSRMHLDYTVTGPRLPAPVRYRLEYVRAP